MSENLIELAKELKTFFQEHSELPRWIFNVQYHYTGRIEKSGSLRDLLIDYKGPVGEFYDYYNSWSYERTDCEGGFEGSGEEVYVIYTFKKKGLRDKLRIRFDGTYQSYSGSDYTCWYFVNRKIIKVAKYDVNPILGLKWNMERL